MKTRLTTLCLAFFIAAVSCKAINTNGEQVFEIRHHAQMKTNADPTLPSQTRSSLVSTNIFQIDCDAVAVTNRSNGHSAAVLIDQTNAWDLYTKALSNVWTTHSFVFVTVVDKKAGSRRCVCIAATSLLAAISIEHSVSDEKAQTMALAQRNRVFEFSHTESLGFTKPLYSDDIPNKMRQALKRYSNNELRKGTKLYVEKPDPDAIAYRAAMAHVLLERGILSHNFYEFLVIDE